MGSYGIGPARIVAAAIEQRADEKGICWPPAIAPWSVHLVALGKGGDEVADAADAAYDALAKAGIETVLDDRPAAGTGEKLTDAELVGCPLRITIGKRGLAEGVAEAQVRSDGREEKIPLAEIADAGRVDPRGARVGPWPIAAGRSGRCATTCASAARRCASDSRASACSDWIAPAPIRLRPAPGSRCARSRSRTSSATSGWRRSPSSSSSPSTPATAATPPRR